MFLCSSGAFRFDVKIDGVQVSAVSNPVKRRQPGARPGCRINSAGQQEINNAG